MDFLTRERAALQHLLPGLDERLAGYPLADLERPGSPGIAAFRECGGPGLLAPEEYGGAGAGALDAVRVQRAIGARSPSLAVATTMHHFSLASLVALDGAVAGGLQWLLIEGIARGGKLLASGFAEGRPGTSILDPTMRAVVTPDGVRVSGVKRPCSLARSMDLLTASVRLSDADGRDAGLAVVLVPAPSEGMTVSPFWASEYLAGAESDQVDLDGVLVPEELVVRVEPPPGQVLDGLQSAGFVWFELLMTAAYLGTASALVERALHDEHAAPAEAARLVVEVEAAMAAVENVARQLPARQTDHRLLVDALIARYAAQDAIARVVPRAVELLGGHNFIRSSEIGYLAGCVNGLSLQPPARSRMAVPILGFLRGEPLVIA
jgi:alkylation response protein AidB-like acyl-CoA dehydrogenase